MALRAPLQRFVDRAAERALYAQRRRLHRLLRRFFLAAGQLGRRSDQQAALRALCRFFSQQGQHGHGRPARRGPLRNRCGPAPGAAGLRLCALPARPAVRFRWPAVCRRDPAADRCLCAGLWPGLHTARAERRSAFAAAAVRAVFAGSDEVRRELGRGGRRAARPRRQSRGRAGRRKEQRDFQASGLAVRS